MLFLQKELRMIITIKSITIIIKNKTTMLPLSLRSIKLKLNRHWDSDLDFICHMTSVNSNKA